MGGVAAWTGWTMAHPKFWLYGPHLGHIITYNGSDKLDIMSRRSNFICQVNNVICWFNKLNCYTKTRLLKSYCFSFYGCELWNLNSLDVQSVCVAWRMALH